MASWGLFFFALLSFSAVVLRPAFAENEEDPGLVMNFYKESCPQAEDIITEQVKLLYKRHKNTAFSWLRNIFHDCAVQVSNRCSLSFSLDFCCFYHILMMGFGCFCVLFIVMWCFTSTGFYKEEPFWEGNRQEFWAEEFQVPWHHQGSCGEGVPWSGLLCRHLGFVRQRWHCFGI